MKVLITGAAGGLARRIVHALEPDHDLTLADLPGAQGFGSPLHRWLACDVTEPDQVEAAVHGQDAVVHTVGLYRNRREIPLTRFADVMVKGTWMVVDAAARAGVSRFVNISSINAAGGTGEPDHRRPAAEQLPHSVDQLGYGLAKRLAEVAATAYGEAHPSMAVVNLRPGVFDTPNPPDASRPHGEGFWYRHVHVDDVVDAVRNVVTAPSPVQGTFALVEARPDAMFAWEETEHALGAAPRRVWRRP